VPEYKVQETKRSRLILLHYGIFKIGWDWLLLLCTFYIAVTVPYNAAFVTTSHDGVTRRASIASDVIVEMLLAIGQLLTEHSLTTLTHITYHLCLPVWPRCNMINLGSGIVVSADKIAVIVAQSGQSSVSH